MKKLTFLLISFIMLRVTVLSNAQNLSIGEDGNQNIEIYGVSEKDNLGWKAIDCDINGDNKNDLVVSAPQLDKNGDGNVYIIFGDKFPNTSSISDVADITISGKTNSNDSIGTSLAKGDINGDGIDDLVIGAYKSNVSTSTTAPTKNEAGAVYVIFGNKDFYSNYSIELDTTAPNHADITIIGANQNDWTGYALVCGNIDQDLEDEIIIGAPKSSSNGKIYIVEKTTYSFIDLSKTYSSIKTITGETSGDYFGYSLSIGDINGDKKNDIIVGALNAEKVSYTDTGIIYIFYNDTGFPSNASNSDKALYKKEDNDYVGFTLNSNFIDNDSRADIIATCKGNSSAYLFYANDLDNLNPSSTFKLSVTSSCATIGDFNNDNKNDIVIGCSNMSPPEKPPLAGATYIFYGSDSRFKYQIEHAYANCKIYGNNESEKTGTSVIFADLNNDKRDDSLIISAPYANTSIGSNYYAKAGKLYVIFSSSTFLSPELKINNGEEVTYNEKVTLTFSVNGNPKQMYISGDITDSFKDTWIDFSSTKEVNLTYPEGQKVINVKFKDNLGIESSIVTATIFLDVVNEYLKVENNLINSENKKAIFTYQIDKSCYVKLKIYNIAGEAVKTFVDEQQPASLYTVEWDGRNDSGKEVASGIYLFSLEAGSLNSVEKIVVIR